MILLRRLWKPEKKWVAQRINLKIAEDQYFRDRLSNILQDPLRTGGGGERGIYRALRDLKTGKGEKPLEFGCVGREKAVEHFCFIAFKKILRPTFESRTLNFFGMPRIPSNGSIKKSK